MALSDIEKEKDKKRNVNRAISADTNKRWSDKQKLEAAQSWLVLGNMSLVSRVLGIPRITLQVWRASNWWKELVEELRVQERMQLSNKMKNIVNAAHAVVENRLLNGDAVLNQKTGEIVYKPVAMRDAHKVAVDLLNQQGALDKMNRGEVAGDDQASDKLEMLAERFAEFATKKIEQSLDKKRTVDLPIIEDVIVKESVDETQMAPNDPVPYPILLGDGGSSDGVGEEEQGTRP